MGTTHVYHGQFDEKPDAIDDVIAPMDVCFCDGVDVLVEP